jgi:hypothetical protein
MHWTNRKANIGPGGIHCPCCAPKNFKKLFTKKQRHHDKWDLAKELNRMDDDYTNYTRKV